MHEYLAARSEMNAAERSSNSPGKLPSISQFWKSIEAAANSNPQTNFPAENGGSRALNSAVRSGSSGIMLQNKPSSLTVENCRERKRINRSLLFLERENRNPGEMVVYYFGGMAGESEKSNLCR